MKISSYASSQAYFSGRAVKLDKLGLASVSQPNLGSQAQPTIVDLTRDRLIKAMTQSGMSEAEQLVQLRMFYGIAEQAGGIQLLHKVATEMPDNNTKYKNAVNAVRRVIRSVKSRFRPTAL